MSLSVTSKTIKIRTRSQMRAAKKRSVDPIILRYNHLFLNLPDGSGRHLLFTDSQILKAVLYPTRDMKATWVHEIWYDGFVSKSIKDIRSAIREFDLPSSASTYSHIRAKVGRQVVHFSFNKHMLKNGIKRAAKFEKFLPKISWISDKLKENRPWDDCPRAAKPELELRQS